MGQCSCWKKARQQDRCGRDDRDEGGCDGDVCDVAGREYDPRDDCGVDMNFLAALFAKAGVNIGTATGAAAGEVKASGDVFALVKAKGLQAQIADYTIVDGSAWVNLSTSVQILTGCTTAFMPTINEAVIVWMSYRLNCGAGSAVCMAGDNSRAYLFLNAVQQGGGVEILGLGGAGVLWRRTTRNSACRPIWLTPSICGPRI